MKLLLFSVAIMALCIFCACSKSSKGNMNGSLSAIIVGESFNVQNCSVGSSSAGGLFIVGSNAISNGRRIILSITSYTAGSTGTYLISAYPDLTVSASVDSNNMGVLAQTGNIVITESTATNISGTFSFASTNSTIVTTVNNGVFVAIER